MSFSTSGTLLALDVALERLCLLKLRKNVVILETVDLPSMSCTSREIATSAGEDVRGWVWLGHRVVVCVYMESSFVIEIFALSMISERQIKIETVRTPGPCTLADGTLYVAGYKPATSLFIKSRGVCETLTGAAGTFVLAIELEAASSRWSHIIPTGTSVRSAGVGTYGEKTFWALSYSGVLQLNGIRFHTPAPSVGSAVLIFKSGQPDQIINLKMDNSKSSCLEITSIVAADSDAIIFSATMKGAVMLDRLRRGSGSILCACKIGRSDLKYLWVAEASEVLFSVVQNQTGGVLWHLGWRDSCTLKVGSMTFTHTADGLSQLAVFFSLAGELLWKVQGRCDTVFWPPKAQLIHSQASDKLVMSDTRCPEKQYVVVTRIHDLC